MVVLNSDSVSVTFSESDTDFDFLIGNHPRNARDFYSFVPKLAEPKDAPGVKLAPLLAIQVTLFPNHGISIGFTNHHVAGYGASIVRFITSWPLLNKFDGSDERLLAKNFLPYYDRSVIKDPHGIGASQWNMMKNYKVKICDMLNIPPHDKVRGTFIIKHDDIIKLKNLIFSKRPSLTHVTSFRVTCAYVWTCLIKSESATTREEIDENGTEFFLCAADYRARLNPPLPLNYFGNCIVGYTASTRHVDLVGKEGVMIGAEIIGEAIGKKTRKDEEWILKGDWLDEVNAIDWKRTFSISGSPKHDFYAVDFSWGRPEKLEYISIDNDNGTSMSLNKSRNSDGDLEIGLCLPEDQMNAFATIFSHGLSIL